MGVTIYDWTVMRFGRRVLSYKSNPKLMKKTSVILLAVLLALGAVVAPAAKALNFSIELGDRPYYDGRDFWDWGWHYIWVPGHWEHHHWIHGYYVREWEWNGRYLHKRHNW